MRPNMRRDQICDRICDAECAICDAVSTMCSDVSQNSCNLKPNCKRIPISRNTGYRCWPASRTDFLGGFLDLVRSTWIQWFTAILFAVLLVLELAFMSETLYSRNYMLSQMPVAAGGIDRKQFEKSDHARLDALDINLKRTNDLKFLNLKPVPGMRHPKPWDSIFRSLMTLKFLVVVVVVGIYCFKWYWWILLIITILPTAYISYTPQIQGLLFLGLLPGTLFTEVICFGKRRDYIMLRLSKRNNGVRAPETRLWLAYPPALLSAGTLCLSITRYVLEWACRYHYGDDITSINTYAL